MPALPADVLLVFASRRAPPVALSLDAAWARLMLHHELLPLTDGEASALLEAWQVPSSVQPVLTDAAGGYPLLLVLAAELTQRTPGESFSSKSWTFVQRALLDVLCPEPQSNAQRLALDVCALTRVTSLELLEHVLNSVQPTPEVNARELFEWLASQPIVEDARPGVRLHALPRTALLSRLRQSRVDKRQRLIKAVREFCVDDLTSAETAEIGMIDLFYLDRDVPAVRELRVPTREVVGVPFSAARAADRLDVVELVQKHEGAAAAELCDLWFSADPSSFEVIRERELEAMLQVVRVGTASVLPKALLERDPALVWVQRFLREHALENGERALVFRWFVDREDYQRPGPRVLALSARLAQLVLSTPRLAYSFCVYRTPSDYAEVFEATGIPALAVATFEVGAHTYTLMLFDWRAQSYREVLVNSFASAQAEPTPPSNPPATAAHDDGKSKVRERVAELGRKAQLTVREREVLELLCLGTSVSEISERLHIRPRTIKFHQENLLKKTGVASRGELFRLLI
ncbi:MAG: helix-turn-helix transcriptional regulator [Polyangiaceae bacterium]